MNNKQTEELISQRTIKIDGLGYLPGKFLKLELGELDMKRNDDKITKISLYAWYSGNKEKCSNFIITYSENYILCKWFHEATEIWNYLLKKYE